MYPKVCSTPRSMVMARMPRAVSPIVALAPRRRRQSPGQPFSVAIEEAVHDAAILAGFQKTRWCCRLAAARNPILQDSATLTPIPPAHYA